MSSKFKVKFQLIWNIITGKYRHVVFININEADFVQLIKLTCLNEGNGIKDAETGYFGMQQVQYYHILKGVANSINEGDIIAAEIENKINIENKTGIKLP